MVSLSALLTRADHVALVRRTKDAFNRGDREGTLAGFSEDVEWVHTADPISGPQTYRGHQELRAFWDKVDAVWEDFRSEAVEYIEAGDHVIVPTRVTGRGRTSGAEVSMFEVELLTLRDGQVTRRESYAELDEALRAAGVPGET